MSDDFSNEDELEETEGEDELLTGEDAPEGTMGEEDMGLTPPGEDEELDAFGFHKEEEETF